MSKLNSEQLQKLSDDAILMSSTGQVRLGQSYMNVLYSIDPDLYNEITDTERDCYYQDKLIPKFIKYITDEQ